MCRILLGMAYPQYPVFADPQNSHRGSLRPSAHGSAGGRSRFGARIAWPGALIAAVTLSGCGGMVADIEPGHDATNAVCAEAFVAMPEQVAGFERRRTDPQSTAAWGDPAAVILRCGVEVPG